MAEATERDNLARVVELLGKEYVDKYLPLIHGGLGKVGRLKGENIVHLLENPLLVDMLLNLGLKGPKSYSLIADQERLGWMMNNYKPVFEENGFTPSQSWIILRRRDWRDIVEWIEKNFNPDEHPTEYVTGVIYKGRGWQERLKPQERIQKPIDLGLILKIYRRDPESKAVVADALVDLLNKRYFGNTTNLSREEKIPRPSLFNLLKDLEIRRREGVYKAESGKTENSVGEVYMPPHGVI